MVAVVNSHRAIVIWILLGSVPLFVGCGQKSSVDRIPVHGTVRLASGETLTGSIIFFPAKGPGATTGVVEGEYTFDRSNGPVKGPQTVVVKRSVSRYVPGRPAEKKAVSRSQKAEWNQSIEVLDDGKYVLDFTLKD